MTRLSLSEIEAIAVKAARGAGLDWGLAEEAAFATRWLVEQGIDGPWVLAGHLDRLSMSPSPPAPLRITGRNWQAESPQPLCPIALGSALNDHFDLPDGPADGTIRLHQVASPALLLAFLAGAAARKGVVVAVAWGETRVLLWDGIILALIGAEGLLADTAPLVTVQGTPKRDQPEGPPGAEVSTATAEALNRLVFRTYVPASDRSRRRAGAAGGDNL